MLALSLSHIYIYIYIYIYHSHHVEFRVTISFLQIYVENIYDLFCSDKVNLAIREDPKTGVYVDNLTQVSHNTHAHSHPDAPKARLKL